jgi:hypothetical protein
MPRPMITATHPLTRRRPASAGPGGIRVFAIDVEQRPQCGGTSKIITALEGPTVMAKLLTHLGLPISAPPRAFDLHSRETSNGLDILAPRADQWPEKSPILDRGLACLTTRLTQQYSSCQQKGCLFFLYHYITHSPAVRAATR